MFRAVNMIGAVANMVHLLYSEMDYAAKHIAKYAMPKKLEFREPPKNPRRQGGLPTARGRENCQKKGRRGVKACKNQLTITGEDDKILY